MTRVKSFSVLFNEIGYSWGVRLRLGGAAKIRGKLLAKCAEGKNTAGPHSVV